MTTRHRTEKSRIKGRWRNALMPYLALLCLIAATAYAQTVTTRIPVGTKPTASAVNPVTNKIYVANRVGNNVTVIDEATNSATTISVYHLLGRVQQHYLPTRGAQDRLRADNDVFKQSIEEAQRKIALDGCNSGSGFCRHKSVRTR